MQTPLPIDTDLRRYLDELAAASNGPLSSALMARQRMEKAIADRDLPPLPDDVRTSEHYIFFNKEDGIRARVYVPAQAKEEPVPVLVYVHGGGWVAGSIETHDPFCLMLSARAGISIVSIAYRLAPEAPYPAAIEDAATAVRWAVEQCPKWNGDPLRLALGGDSAGGHVSAVLANRLAVDKTGPQLRALALLYPVTDHPSGVHPSFAENVTGYGLTASEMVWFWEQFLGADASPDDPEVSPLRAQLPAGLPPTLVATAQYDVLRDEGIAYARKLEAAGVPVTHIHAPDMHHDFAVSPGTVARFPQGDRTIDDIAVFLMKHLGNRQSS
jgi:acetyl esterase